MTERMAPSDRDRPVAGKPRLAIALWIAWFAVVIITALGFLARLIPALDPINNFQIWLAALAVLLLLGALIARDRRLLRPTAALILLQAGLVLLPLSRAGDYDAGRTPTLRLLTFNIYVGNNRFDDIADYVLSSGADIVALQEGSCAAAERLIPKLKRSYPHVSGSGDNCFGNALLTKQPVMTSGQVTVGPRQRPLFVWARLEWNSTPIVVTAAHLVPPVRPNDQASEVTRLINHVTGFKEPQTVAGDFNLTPFS